MFQRKIFKIPKVTAKTLLENRAKTVKFTEIAFLTKFNFLSVITAIQERTENSKFFEIIKKFKLHQFKECVQISLRFKKFCRIKNK